MKWNEVELWKIPEEELHKKMEFKTEMLSDEQGFLCGIIKKVKPKKIVEIGVAEGGTTAVIMNAVSILGLTCEVYSVDLSEKLYYNWELTTGYEYNRLCPFIKNNKSIHSFLFGKTIAAQLKIIGKDIELVILDTMHAVPGGLLDFLSVYPYLSANAMVVLHDVNIDYYYAISHEMKWKNWSNFSFATKLLFSVVRAEKYLNYDKNGDILNIGAFRVNKDTDKCIEDIFFLLHMPWAYCPSRTVMTEYEKLFRYHYDNKSNAIFRKAVDNGFLAYKIRYLAQSSHYGFLFPFEDIPEKSNIVIWGAGNCGKFIYKLLKQNKWCKVILWIDTYCHGKIYDEVLIETPNMILQKEFDFLLIAVENKKIFETIKQEVLEKRWADKNQIVGPIPSFYMS